MRSCNVSASKFLTLIFPEVIANLKRKIRYVRRVQLYEYSYLYIIMIWEVDRSQRFVKKKKKNQSQSLIIMQ
jgi:hypothetical protein